ncbi:UNVERIFIED_CONTAM: hypothetical protein Scaly_1788500 [Sesamum calycinum]|uniref:Uncharacterized protein n=1 Tax=Sesamum calycinum TaxID=2727403 RepID=A0AAW2NXQ7_9LAMI
MVTQRGIEANSLKIKAILDMKAPTNVNEVQRLTGKIAVLSCFISKATEKSLPFFKVLRKAKNFEWDTTCQQAFKELKKYLLRKGCMFLKKYIMVVVEHKQENGHLLTKLYVLGMDIVGHFPLAPGQRKFLLVAIDYCTKWMEVELLARIIEDENDSSRIYGESPFVLVYGLRPSFPPRPFVEVSGAPPLAAREAFPVFESRATSLGMCPTTRSIVASGGYFSPQP